MTIITTRNYDIIKVASDHFDYIVIAKSYISPLQDLTNIARYTQGNVLFDLILINGFEENRYISVEIKNGVFVRGSSKIENEVDEQLQDVSRLYFQTHPDLIDTSILTTSIRKVVKEWAAKCQV